METLGGYRIVRKLGGGERAEIFLGHSPVAQQTPGEPGALPQLVALKVYRPWVTRSSIDLEIDALAQIELPHILRLHDLASGPDGKPVLILERLNPAGLDRLLAGTNRIEAGEAVTALAPLAIALGGFHRRGFFHGGLAATKVLFDDLGAPVIVGLGEARRIGTAREGRAVSITTAALATEPGVADDLDRLAALARAVLAQVTSRGSQNGSGEMLRWLEAPCPARESEAFTAELSDRLFALAEAIPIRLVADRRVAATPGRIQLRLGDSAPAAGGSFRGVAGDPGSPEMPGTAGTESPAGQWISLLPLTPGLERAAEELLTAVKVTVRRLTRALGRVRKRIWLTAALGVVALLSAVLLSQAGAGQPATEGPASQKGPASADGSAVIDDRGATNAVTGTDPLAATALLLELRLKCISDLSVLCLDGVHQVNSAAWSTDQRRIRDIQQGHEFVADPLAGEHELELVDRMGDTALIALVGTSVVNPGETVPGVETTPASVLMIKTEAGWRIRDLLLDHPR